MELTDRIKQELTAMGAPADQLEKIVLDIGKAMIARITSMYQQKLSETDMEMLKDMTQEEATEFLQHKNLPLSLEEIMTVSEQVWTEYKAFMNGSVAL